ncbi:unnamed protein product, partial [Eretmochelys imbricata]
MAAWSREAVLNLYRALLRQGRGLRYTDRDFYLASIRREFRKNQQLERLEDRERQLEKGQAFLNNRLGGLSWRHGAKPEQDCNPGVCDGQIGEPSPDSPTVADATVG